MAIHHAVVYHTPNITSPPPPLRCGYYLHISQCYWNAALPRLAKFRLIERFKASCLIHTCSCLNSLTVIAFYQ